MEVYEMQDALAELIKYRELGCTPEQLHTLLAELRGECWLCEQGEPYYTQALSPNEPMKNLKLTKCRLEEQGEHTIAANRNKGCAHWCLKHFRTEQNETENF